MDTHVVRGPSTVRRVPTPFGTAFWESSADKGKIPVGSPTVRMNGQMAARVGDPPMTCHDPVDWASGTVVAAAIVLIG